MSLKIGRTRLRGFKWSLKLDGVLVPFHISLGNIVIQVKHVFWGGAYVQMWDICRENVRAQSCKLNGFMCWSRFMWSIMLKINGKNSRWYFMMQSLRKWSIMRDLIPMISFWCFGALHSVGLYCLAIVILHKLDTCDIAFVASMCYVWQK